MSKSLPEIPKVSDEMRTLVDDVADAVFLPGSELYDASLPEYRALLSRIASLEEDKNRACNCGDFVEGVKAINAPIVLQQIRAGKSFASDHFKAWKYCPWCGGTITVRVASLSSESKTP